MLSASVQPKITTFVNKNNAVLNHCVNLAIKGKPFSLFKDSDMKIITKLALSSFGEKGEVTDEQVRKGVINRVSEMRQKVREQLKGRQLSISADFGSRNGFDFFGKFFFGFFFQVF